MHIRTSIQNINGLFRLVIKFLDNNANAKKQLEYAKINKI